MTNPKTKISDKAQLAKKMRRLITLLWIDDITKAILRAKAGKCLQ